MLGAGRAWPVDSAPRGEPHLIFGRLDDVAVDLDAAVAERGPAAGEACFTHRSQSRAEPLAGPRIDRDRVGAVLAGIARKLDRFHVDLVGDQLAHRLEQA